MTAIHFRPKYDIEQYLVLFSFPAALDNYPEISVELVSGNASDVESFTGLPVIQGADIFVRVAGGTAGCVYKIICTGLIDGVSVKREGLIAVMPTTAEIPSGSPPVPLARFYTTPPYPIQRQDHVSLSVRLSAATLRGVLHEVEADARASLAVEFTGGSLRFPVVDAFPKPNTVSLSVEFTGGSLRYPLVDANASSSSSLSVELVEGVLRTALVSADTQETHSTLHVEFTGGTLYEP